MARKSRKETVAVIAPEVDNTCRAAIYVRLSVEDTHTRSASIETQQMIIARFLEQNPEISVYDTYIDNGATGTNFHRPGFQQMLSDIEAGHANCVIVKDLSRLGRNTIDTGYYIEQYFRTLVVLLLLKNDALRIWHLYIVNAVSGLMNTVQQPASEVATTALLPRKFYQKVGGLRYLSSSLNAILTPIITTVIMGLWGIDTVIAIDLISFLIAFFVLLFLIRIPRIESEQNRESVLKSAAEGIRWLKRNPVIFHLMLFLAAINLVASMYNAAFPAMMLTKASEAVMGTVNSVIGITMLTGSILASVMKTPKSRVKAIWCCLMLSMCTENFFLAFGNSVGIWCFGATLGWIAITWMNANLDAINRLNIPEKIQGRVFAARNSFQFFTIPVGYFLGGLLADQVFEPIMATQGAGSFLTNLFGTGKGSGAAFLFAVLWLAGIGVCLIFQADKHIWKLEKKLP